MKAEDEGCDGGKCFGAAANSLDEARCRGFVWDNNSRLYFHADTGFYYDPGAGWYYSSRNGLFYSFENGAYVPLPESSKAVGDSSYSGALHGRNSAPDSDSDHVPGWKRDMKGKQIREEEGGGSGNQQEGPGSSGFVWDDESQLYFHAGTGFYHDPAAGWYYSSSDGLYYRFEKGAYVPYLESCQRTGDSSPGGDDPISDSVLSSPKPFEAAHCEIPSSTTCMDPLETFDGGNMVEKLEKLPPPPSEWLEETLIDLYLAGPSSVHDATSNIQIYGSLDKDAAEPQACQPNSKDLQLYHSSPASTELPEEDEKLPNEADGGRAAASENFGEDEEKWQAQYGQVVKTDDEPALPFHPVDLWDWSLIVESEKHPTSSKKKSRKRQMAQLAGRLNNTSCRLHPSVSSSFLKTASICEVHLDLVQVVTGKVYRLRNPNSAYLASLSSYDASNPTKDWDFPELHMYQRTQTSTSSETTISQPSIKDVHKRNLLAKPHQSAARNTLYKDRAAMRRSLHGGYGIGFENKDAAYEDESTSFSEAEAANMSIGPGSYARKIMENMGWKEGDVLGKTQDGLVEPLKVIGNKGYAGLGWNGT